MLKGKKALYILIPLNVFIWGFFIFRFIEAYGDSDVPEMEGSRMAVKIPELNDSEIYKLSLDYKDPFLKDAERPKDYNTQKSGSEKPVVKTPTVTPVKTPTVAPKQLPDLRYLGLVKNSSSGMATALISLDGQSRLVKVNDAIDGLVFKSFNRDSLVAQRGKEKMVVRK
jgi:hypothetical protein